MADAQPVYRAPAQTNYHPDNTGIAGQIRHHWLLLTALGGMVLFQAYAYYRVLELSLGPRVILQPWLMIERGYLPYEQIADHHSPLMPLLISVLTPFVPDGVRLARIVLVALLSLSTLLTFWAGKREAGWLGGVGAAFFFVCWSAHFGFGKLWHESFLTPLYALLLILYRPAGSNRSLTRLVATGIVGGIAILTKQQATAVVVGLILWNVATGWHARRGLRETLVDNVVVGVCAVLPFALYGIYHYSRAGTLENLWFWIVSFNLTGSFAALAAQAPELKEVWGIAPAYVLIPAAVLCVFGLKRNGDTQWETLGWGLILLLTSSLGVYPRFAPFHLQSSLPVLAWLSSTTLVRFLTTGEEERSPAPFGSRRFATGMAAGLALLWALTSLVAYQPVLTSGQPRRIAEYSDLLPLADEVRQQVSQQDGVYIFPDDEATSNLYYLLRCPPPRFWVFSYPWYMTDQVRRRVMQTLEGDPPQWIIYPVGRCEIEVRAPEVLRYIQDNYQLHSRLHWAQGEVQLLKRR